MIRRFLSLSHGPVCVPALVITFGCWLLLPQASTQTVSAHARLSHTDPDSQGPPPEPYKQLGITRPSWDRTADGWAFAGGGFRAELGAAGMTFDAAGTGGSPSARLKVALTAVGRRDASGRFSGLAVGRGTGTSSGDLARFDHKEVVASYQVRPGGVEASYTFVKLPDGEGDLIVRLAVQTDLEPATPGLDVESLVFAHPRGGGVTVGAVTGIDANGVKATGFMRYSAGQLEFGLPGEFARRAALPLVLDPLIGRVFSIPNGGAAQYSRIAYDTTNDIFLVVWRAGGFVGVPPSTHAQRISPSGVAVGLRIDIATNASIGSVANVDAVDRFVVTYNSGFLGFAVTVDARTGALGPPLGTGLIRGSDLGGGVAGAGSALLVWENGNQVFAAPLHVGAGGSLTQGSSVLLGSGIRPSISKGNGVAGRHMVVWGANNFRDIASAIVDRNGNVLDQMMIANAVEKEINAQVDGDGTKWLVEYLLIRPGSIDHIITKPVFWDSNTAQAFVGPGVVVATSTTAGLAAVDVGWGGGSYLIAYAEGSYVVGGTGQQVLTVDPYSALVCEPRVQPRLNALSLVLEIATQQHGSPPGGDLAMLVESSSARFYRLDDGITTDLGGDCGNGGFAAATCAVVGNQNFVLRVREARRGVPAFLALGTQQVGYQCGGCTLVPNPLALVSAGLTDSRGNAAVPVPIPNIPGMVGATFLEQWITVGGTACPLGIELSNALRVQIQ